LHGRLPGEQKTLSDYRASVKAKQESVKTEASLGRNVNRRIIGVKVHALAEWRQILGGNKIPREQIECSPKTEGDRLAKVRRLIPVHLRDGM